MHQRLPELHSLEQIIAGLTRTMAHISGPELPGTATVTSAEAGDRLPSLQIQTPGTHESALRAAPRNRCRSPRHQRLPRYRRSGGHLVPANEASLTALADSVAFRSEESRRSIEKALKDMRRDGETITVVAVASQAGLACATVYRHKKQLKKIHRQRRSAAVPHGPADGSAAAVQQGAAADPYVGITLTLADRKLTVPVQRVIGSNDDRAVAAQ